MKKITHILVAIVLMTSFGIYSCSSDGARADPVAENPETFLRYTVDETTYQYENLGTIGSLRLAIEGRIGEANDANFSWIVLGLPREPVPGTYDINKNGDYELDLDSNPLNIDNGEATQGSVTLSTVSSDFITGTFIAVLTNESGETVTLTDGEFKAFGL